MEVVACFLKKYFSLLANGEVESLKELYSEDAIVELNVNGEITEGTGSSLVESLVTRFANGVVTVNDVKKSSSNDVDAIVIVSSGFVTLDGVDANFTQKVTLFSAAKHWYIGFENFDVVIPEPEEVVVEEEEEEEEEPAPVEEEEVAVEKEPTPQRSPALKPKEPEVPKVVAEKPAPIAKKTEPEAAPKSWAAAVTKTAPAASAPKVVVATSVAPPVSKPVVPATEVKVYFAVPILGNAILEKEKDPKKMKDLVLAEVSTQIEKINIVIKRDISSLRANPTESKMNVFIDFVIPDALEKLQNLTVFGNRVNATLQKKSS